MDIAQLSLSYAALPDKGEDSFSIRVDGHGGAMCVADGCGGLGGRRYEQLGNATGAYLAARLVTRSFMTWAEDNPRLPQTAEDGKRLCGELGDDLHGILSRFNKNHDGGGGRIVGSMQRLLPTTFCAAVFEARESVDCCFMWAGDSRGYALDARGLHQLTRDHALGEPDALESLYRDVPLQNLLSADKPASISMRRLSPTAPCLLLCATDGVFGCLKTPMEFEMLLLSTMRAAGDYSGWQRKLEIALNRLAGDDATIVCAACGFTSYQDMCRILAPRREELARRFIAPLRSARADTELLKSAWLEYRDDYDWTEGAGDVADWRI